MTDTNACVPPWRTAAPEPTTYSPRRRAVEHDTAVDIVSVFVESFRHSVEEEAIFNNVLQRARERGTIVSRVMQDDEVFFKMATDVQAERVQKRTDNVTILMNISAGIKIRYHQNFNPMEIEPKFLTTPPHPTLHKI